ncbi:hypothetical protein KDX40_04815 [Burkholderia ambifaria]|uniref:hypothetical protein n=1 Tax=Burkholderia ambifaria TaxID=152480 RepID=UPI001B9CF518|nr:hypothetical protein [Burkholderia ambifaria]MBR8343059.1 hypothetical protein [Burkholderia ambifaria]
MKRESDYRDAGGEMQQDKNRLERIWDEVQMLNRASGPWGVSKADGIDIDAVHRRKAA